MVAARVDGGWIAVESEKAFTKLLKIILRIDAMKRMCRMEPRSWIMDHEEVGGDDGQTFPVVCVGDGRISSP
jgi:hypothetical protein